jgi:predicted MFS family arabinose efflux permease
MSATDTAGEAGAAQPLTKGYVNYALWMLLIVYTLNFLDRQIVSILGGPIRAELGLDGFQFGLLTGLAFAFVYTFLGIPIARYSDRFTSNRVGVIAVSLAVWSGFTALCGLATSYIQMLLARVGVGVGEAGCTPPAHSLIADKVPPEKRASALAFYSMGVPIGTFLGFALGGLIAEALGWRWAFLLVGLPGVALAVIVWLTLKEPRKLGLIAAPKADAPKVGFGAALKQLAGVPSYWYACFAAAVLAFVGYGQAAFLPQFVGFAHQMPLGQIGVALGVVIGLGGAIGTFMGGAMADAAAKKDTRAYFSLPAIATIIGAPVFIAAMLYPSGAPGLSGGVVDGTVVMLALLALGTLLGSIWYGPVYASIQGVVPPALRASAVAIMLFIVNMIGLGFGPPIFGLLTDILGAGHFQGLGVSPDTFAAVCKPIFQDDQLLRAGSAAAQGLSKANPALAGACYASNAEGLRWGILYASLVALLAVALFWLGRATIRQDLARAQAAAAA